MDQRMKEKIKSGSLTNADVRRLIDWQLSLRAERIDHGLVDECLLFLYPDAPGLGSAARDTLWNRLAEAIFSPSRARRRGDRMHRRRYPAKTVLIAALLMLLLAGAAIAATLGLFGYFVNRPDTEMSRQRLEHLEEVAINVGKTQQVLAPAGDMNGADPETDYGRLLSQQFSRQFELTVDQAYCDGNKLYYTYRISEPQRTFEMHEGLPTGFEEWDWEEPGKRLADTYWTPGATEEERSQAAAFFAEHERAYAVESLFGIGDGACLDDGSERGKPLMIFDSSMEEPDPYTEFGFQQVDLPEGYVPGDTISFFLHVAYYTQVVCQDENGVYRTSVNNLENRGYFPVRFTADIAGAVQELRAEASFEEYNARVQMAISDVDISGVVEFDAPQEWIDDFNDTVYDDQTSYVYDYKLVADGVEYPNVGGGYGIGIHDTCWNVDIRFDLPQSAEHLALIPRRLGMGWIEEESIIIR